MKTKRFPATHVVDVEAIGAVTLQVHRRYCLCTECGHDLLMQKGDFKAVSNRSAGGELRGRKEELRAGNVIHCV